ncbi:DUF1454 family protein [Dickeya sp. CFBP 2040]|uniref:DUF1454 family protein n=1 Tax=Dickeya poaceiphila TaxID=568768 RepID=A0A5B8HUN5_9GAMM|nr:MULTISPECIES: DUF1454 family protein [Dickeya]NKI73020.1 DUF1454 family protein [Dickeya sp. CFBP 2040]QDX31876.1 DUF1454 family protein [Dickeya poaceiphila]
MKNALLIVCCLSAGLLCIPSARSESLFQPQTPAAAPYLLPGSPTFDMNIVQFRTRYNLSNPSLPIGEYRVVDTGDDSPNLTRAASRINDHLYSSTALEKGTGKIKTMQITWLPKPKDTDQNGRRKQAIGYMAALMRTFMPSLTNEQSLKKIETLLEKGKGQHFYQQTEGALRYVVADHGEKGLTFAVEPIKLALSDS